MRIHRIRLIRQIDFRHFPLAILKKQLKFSA